MNYIRYTACIIISAYAGILGMCAFIHMSAFLTAEAQYYRRSFFPWNTFYEAQDFWGIPVLLSISVICWHFRKP